MPNYVNSLLDSRLPFELWDAVLLWAVLFFGNHWVVRLVRAANDAQHVISIQDWSALRRSQEPRYIVGQVLIAGFLFLSAPLLGPSAFVFFAGGLIVALACTLALNVQGLWAARALAQPDAATGELTFSTAYAFRHTAHRAAGGALACALIGLVTMHLAPFGGAFFLASMAYGYVRRARNVGARA